jgi:tRNA/rRNA methyltransferase
LRQSVEIVDRYPQETYEVAPFEAVENFIQHLEQTLYDIEFLDPQQPKRLVQRMRRLFQRARLEKEEVNILRGILTAAQKARKGNS